MVDALNILPILLCIAMYLQQKLSPQSQMASANPQAASQQKMMMVMMPIMMLAFFYCAPSGLNLYFMTSTFAGVLESHVIRKHLRQAEERQKAATVATTGKVTSRLKPKKKKDRPPVKYI